MRIVFIGTGEIGVPTLRWLLNSEAHELVGIVTQPDKPAGRTQRLEAPPIKAALGGSTIPLQQPPRIKREEAIAEIRALAPEMIVVMAYGQILPRAVLEIPRGACLNLHASILPAHRGAAPIQAAILAGDRETGITAMYMDEGLDTGDILLQRRIPIRPEETGGSLHDRLGEMAPAVLEEALKLFAAGAAPRRKQDPAAATYAPKLEREHGHLDWTQSSETIGRMIRAYDPWPGTFVLLRDTSGMARKLKIFEASQTEERLSAPGALSIVDGALSIGTADASLLLREVQLEGKKRMSAAELLRGHSWLATATIAPVT